MPVDLPSNHEHANFHFDHVYFDAPLPYDSILLYQVGDLSCESGFAIGEHVQICYEISYIAAGSGYYYTNGRRYPVKAGDIYLSLPGERHNGIANEQDPFRYYYLGFGFENNAPEASRFSEIQQQFDQNKHPLVQDKYGIESAFLGIFNELIHLKPFSDLLITTYIHQILLLAYRNFYANWDKPYTKQNYAEGQKTVIYDMIQQIDISMDHGQTFKLTQLEQQLGYSYSHLSHLFRQQTGNSIKQYYNSKRFEKAVEWLKEGTYSITVISEKLGYVSIHTFSKAFRKTYGISPSEYQRLLGVGSLNEQQP